MRWAILISLIILPGYVPGALAGTDSWLSYKTEGVQSLDAHELTAAEKYFKKALDIAKQTGSDPRLAESLDHMVHVKILQGELKQAQPYYEAAIAITQTNKSKQEQKTISQWINDIGDFYYKLGEAVPNEPVKEYCMEHWIDTRMASLDEFDPILVPRINLLTVKYYMRGDYAEAERLKWKALAGIIRDPKKASLHIATGEMGNFLFLQNKFDEAADYYKKACGLNDKVDPTNKISHAGSLERQLGTIEYAKGNMPSAQAYVLQAAKLHNNCNADRELAFDFYILGLIEDKKGDNQAAVKCFQQSLQLSKKMEKYPNPSLMAMAADHLATEWKKQGKSAQANKVIAYANKTRAAHPEWRKVPNPDPEKFFLVSASLPFPTDVIPNHTHLDLY